MGRITVGGPGSLHYTGTIGEVRRVNRIGTLPYIGRVGTLPYVGRVGTQPYVGRVGTLPRIVGATPIRNLVPLGPGTTWVGSWQHVGSWPAWAFAIRSIKGGGSFAILGGAVGTSTAEGTVYGFEQVRGSVLEMLPPIPSVAQSPLRYVAPVFRRTGATRGSVTVHLTWRP